MGTLSSSFIGILSLAMTWIEKFCYKQHASCTAGTTTLKTYNTTILSTSTPVPALLALTFGEDYLMHLAYQRALRPLQLQSMRYIKQEN